MDLKSKLSILKFLGRETGFCRPYCHRQGQGDPYHRALGPGLAFADPDVHNLNQTQIIDSNPANLNQSLNGYCNGESSWGS